MGPQLQSHKGILTEYRQRETAVTPRYTMRERGKWKLEGFLRRASCAAEVFTYLYRHRKICRLVYRPHRDPTCRDSILDEAPKHFQGV